MGSDMIAFDSLYELLLGGYKRKQLWDRPFQNAVHLFLGKCTGEQLFLVEANAVGLQTVI